MSILRKSSTPKYLSKHSAKSNLLLFAFLGILLLVTLIFSVLLGSSDIDALKTLLTPFSADKTSPEYRIIFYVRLPRAIASVLCGCALAVSGVIIQAVLNNAMASPGVIGVNAGAGLAAALVTALVPSAVFLIPPAAFIGALTACLMIYTIASKSGASRITVTLAGLTVSSILTAGINTIKTLFPNSVYNLTTFSVGGLSGVNYTVLKYTFPLILVCMILCILFAKDIDVLSLGEETASSLGLRVSRLRFFLLILASILAGCAVCIAGLIGFVGLIVPHIVRRITTSKHTILIPSSAVCGAELVLLCDILSRILFKPYEIPVGILLSFIGGFFFLALILTKRSSKLYD